MLQGFPVDRTMGKILSKEQLLLWYWSLEKGLANKSGIRVKVNQSGGLCCMVLISWYVLKNHQMWSDMRLCTQQAVH